MDARMHQAEFAGMAPFARPRDAVTVQELRLAAAQAQDDAIARGLRRVMAAVAAPVVGFIGGIASLPKRLRLEAELRALTDRELEDIGLTRGDIDGVVRRA